MAANNGHSHYKKLLILTGAFLTMALASGCQSSNLSHNNQRSRVFENQTQTKVSTPENPASPQNENINNKLHNTNVDGIEVVDGVEKQINVVKLQSDQKNGFEGAKVKAEDLLQGCFKGKDCIPSIDQPKFESIEDATWLKDEDVVFALNYKGQTRAYPQRILNWHEIVNDVVAGDPIAVTFCPLCGSAVAFEPKVDNQITELGVSGKLHNSDLVMYDRLEGNLWQQITGEAIVGPAARRGENLVEIPLATTTWGEWKKAHPQTKVLSRETGFNREYSRYPYGTYEQDDELYFGVQNEDRTLPLKTVVYGVNIAGKTKAYPAEIIDQKIEITDQIGDTEIMIKKADSGEIVITNKATQQRINHLRLFWFAWAAFNQDTEIYENQ